MSAVAQEEKAADGAQAQAHASQPKDAAQSEDEQWQEVTDEAPFGPTPAAAAVAAKPSPSAAAVAAESASVPPPVRRVKLYALNKSGVWEDKGPLPTLLPPSDAWLTAAADPLPPQLQPSRHLRGPVG